MDSELLTDVNFDTATGRTVAPEDLRRGDYLYLQSELYELVSPCAISDAGWRAVEPIRLHLLPDRDAAPIKVLDVCLPAVLVKCADGTHKTLDARQHRFVRLTDRFGRKAFKRLRSKPETKGTGAE